ncbi:hypothetical protein PABG_12050 [Paracoccidioides brasiliensis Pb03]|nr:hypothetical protein PABG_12050 [Paracoccidioides brasiliensis Pb03]
MPNEVLTELAIEDLRGQKLLRLAKKPYVSSIDMFKSHIMKLPFDTSRKAHELAEELLLLHIEELAGHDFASPSQIIQNLIKRPLKS